MCRRATSPDFRRNFGRTKQKPSPIKKDQRQPPKTQSQEVLLVGEEVNTELGHGIGKRKSWRRPGSSKRGQQDEAGQQLLKNTRGRIENKPVMGSESGRHWFGGGLFFLFQRSSLMPRLTGPEESCLVQIDAAFSQPQ